MQARAELWLNRNHPTVLFKRPQDVVRACTISDVKDHPSFPSAGLVLYFSSRKTLLIPREPLRPPVGVNVPGSNAGWF